MDARQWTKFFPWRPGAPRSSTMWILSPLQPGGNGRSCPDWRLTNSLAPCAANTLRRMRPWAAVLLTTFQTLTLLLTACYHRLLHTLSTCVCVRVFIMSSISPLLKMDNTTGPNSLCCFMETLLHSSPMTGSATLGHGPVLFVCRPLEIYC